MVATNYDSSKFTSIFQIVAVEQEEESHQNTISFSVELINWNDELPIFGLNEYHFYVNETVPSNTSIGFVIATDRDIDDRVEYVELMPKGPAPLSK